MYLNILDKNMFTHCFDNNEIYSYEIKEENYSNLYNLFAHYVNINNDFWEELKNNIVLKFYQKGDQIDYRDKKADKFIFLNKGAMKGVQNSTDKIWYLYFNNPLFTENDYGHCVIQDFFSFIYNHDSNIHYETLSDCEVLEISYDVLKQLCKKYFDSETFFTILSDLEMKRIDIQLKEQLEKDLPSKYNSFIKNKIYLLSLLDVDVILNYLQIPISNILSSVQKSTNINNKYSVLR